MDGVMRTEYKSCLAPSCSHSDSEDADLLYGRFQPLASILGLGFKFQIYNHSILDRGAMNQSLTQRGAKGLSCSDHCNKTNSWYHR